MADLQIAKTGLKIVTNMVSVALFWLLLLLQPHIASYLGSLHVLVQIKLCKTAWKLLKQCIKIRVLSF